MKSFLFFVGVAAVAAKTCVFDSPNHVIIDPIERGNCSVSLQFNGTGADLLGDIVLGNPDEVDFREAMVQDKHGIRDALEIMLDDYIIGHGGSDYIFNALSYNVSVTRSPLKCTETESHRKCWLWGLFCHRSHIDVTTEECRLAIEWSLL